MRRALSTVLEQTAISLPIEKRDYGIWVTPIVDSSLVVNAHFVLAVTADLPAETLRQQIPAYIKIAPVEQIRTLITRALPGIDLQPLAVAPRQIPFHTNFVYFSFNQHHSYWKQLEQAGGIAFHVSGNFPGLILNLWALRG